jgi:hypothetical protein
MVRLIAPGRVASFLLLVVCGAFCQSGRLSADSLQCEGSDSRDEQCQDLHEVRSFPDAPSAQTSIQAEPFRPFLDRAHSPSALAIVGASAALAREPELAQVAPRLRANLTAAYEAGATKQKSNSFFDKYLYPSLRNPKLQYRPSTSSSFLGRATDAASGIFVTRDNSGRRRLNASYFLGVLTSVAVHTAHRPYWARSASEPFNNFGSTIGSDAGVNLFHEFQPCIRQIIRGHAPKFVSRIEDRITSDGIPALTR